MPGSWPAAVYFEVVRGKEKVNSCGGTLIDKTTILTAAHCVDHLENETAILTTDPDFDEFGRSRASSVFVHLGLHHAAIKTVENIVLVRKIILVS